MSEFKIGNAETGGDDETRPWPFPGQPNLA